MNLFNELHPAHLLLLLLPARRGMLAGERGVCMFSDILHDVIVTIIVTGLGALYKVIKKGISKNANQPLEGTYSPKVIKGQFWWSLLVYTLSLSVIFSVTWEFSFSWPVLLKSFAFTLAPISFVLIWGAFDAAFAYRPDGEIEKPASNGKANQSSKE